MFNLFSSSKQEITLENLEKKYESKIRHMLLNGQISISNSNEMAYYQLTRGALANYIKKPFSEALLYFSRGKEYKQGETIYFKDLIEVWTPSSSHASGKINVQKIQNNPENISATILILKLIMQKQGLSFEYIHEGNLKVGFKYPA